MIRRVLVSLLTVSFLVFSSLSYSLPFNIMPKTAFPVGVPVNGSVLAYYTVTNNTASLRNNNYVKYLPSGITQISNNGTGLTAGQRLL